MKYKLGDRVRIKSLDWYNENKNEYGNVEFSTHVFVPRMSKYCGMIVTIEDIFEDTDGNVAYYMDGIDWDWTDEMIECKVEKETKFGTASNPIEPKSNSNCLTLERVDEIKPEPKFKVGDKITNGEITFTILTLSSDRYGAEDTFGECGSVCFKSQDDWKLVEEKCNYVRVDNMPDITQTKTASACSCNGFYGYSDSEGNEISEWNLPEGYQFVDEGGNIINATKIVLEKKKKEYPKTYEECCKVLGVDSDNFLSIRNLYRDDGDEELTDYERDLLGKFDSLWELRICRDAYWKIAGEEIGLGKPWKPDWDAKDNHFYTIYTFNGKIECSATAHRNAVLIFPTKEMRDAFYENFKEEIEICKEFL